MKETRPVYAPPLLVDYGTLTELTQSNGLADVEDGCAKQLHQDGSNGCVIR